MADEVTWTSPTFATPSEIGEGDSLGSFPSESVASSTFTEPETGAGLKINSKMVSPFPVTHMNSISIRPSTEKGASKGSGVQCFEEDTRSSWSIDSSRITNLKEVLADEDSQNSFGSQKSASTKRRYSDDEAVATFGSLPPENVLEYQWPPNNGGEYYILQEQISEYLGVKSFKRKYPDLFRRPVDLDEKQFLRDKGAVSETQCELGLTALRSDDVMELMGRDYPEKYQLYIQALEEKERRSISEKHREYTTPSIEKSKMADFVRKAVQAAADYNAHLNQERREERRTCFDLQTHTIQYPIGKLKRLPKEATRMGHYPVALIPGQFQDYYKTYTSEELKYFPLNTVLYGPPKEINSMYVQQTSDGNHSDSEESCASDESCCSSSQGTQEGSGESSSGSETQNGSTQPTPTPKVPPVSVQLTYKPKIKPNALCKVCHNGNERNKEGKPEELVHCYECNNSGHPTCLELTDEMVNVVRTYPWQCMDCKTCVHCRDPYDEDKMMFCDKCDRGYHTFCVGLKNIPSGRWICNLCGQCSVCGAKTPGPDARSQWQYEILKTSGPAGETSHQQLLCIACAKHRKR